MTDNTLILYTTSDGQSSVVLRELGGQLWLTQAEMAELYQVTPQSITQHIQAIYQAAEIDEAATCKEYLQVQTEGGREVKRQLKHYSLPMILAIGYRVRSGRGTQFRQWATSTLGEYLQKGFAIDDERLKNPPVGTLAAPDYFDELLARIRDIRASEKRVYLRVREIFTLAADYQPSVRDTNLFFQTIQNKLHFASTGQTAAELVYRRADAAKPFTALTHMEACYVLKKKNKNYPFYSIVFIMN